MAMTKAVQDTSKRQSTTTTGAIGRSRPSSSSSSIGGATAFAAKAVFVIVVVMLTSVAAASARSAAAAAATAAAAGRSGGRAAAAAFLSSPAASAAAGLGRCAASASAAAAARFSSSALSLSSTPPPDFTVDDDSGGDDGGGGNGNGNDSLASARAAAAAASSAGFDPNTSFGPGVPGGFEDAPGGGGGSVGAAAAQRFESRPTDYEYVPTDDKDDGGRRQDGSRRERPAGGRSRGRRSRVAGGEGRSEEGGGGGGGGGGSSSFREDFQGTRVFVQGIPDHVDWKQLKDHFGVAGEVVFASVSVDSRTGESKGCGIVQYETTDGAREAVRVMRYHPLDGGTLYVREDVQEKRSPRGMREGGGGERRRRGRDGGTGPPDDWRCADELNAEDALSPGMYAKVLTLVDARDEARRRKDYELSDALREQLKSDHDVHVDDRLKLWWVSEDGGVPDVVAELKGEGRWGKARPWRRIPTTPEMDGLVDRDRVEYLLKQRDEARRTKNFARADALLEEARDSPQGDVELKIHDESRTWRVWTIERPPPPPGGPPRKTQEMKRMEAAEEALELVRSKSTPDKVREVEALLNKFPGREFNILRKLKQRFAGGGE